MKKLNYVDDESVKRPHGSRIKGNRNKEEEVYDDNGKKPQWRADRRQAKRDKVKRLGITE